MNVDYASCYLPQWVHMYIHMHIRTHMHTNTFAGIINEYVCPAEGKRREKMNSSGLVQTDLLSSRQSGIK